VEQRTFELRFDSIGGLGAHAAGQILATAAVLRMGMNGSHFSSYGSEKKGSRIRSFIRLGSAEVPIRTSAPVERPDAIVVFHAALLRDPTTLAGLRRSGTFIYDAPSGPASAERSRPNAVLLGTLCGAFPFLRERDVLDALTEEFASRRPEAVASNTRAFERGRTEHEVMEDVGHAEGDVPATVSEPAWGYLTQPVGGVVPLPGNTAWNDLSASRTGSIPVLDREKCAHCGVCDLVCPDLCFVWGAGPAGGRFERELMGIDYRYCKGCLRCVESCPTGALAKTAETAGLADRLRVPLFPGIVG